MSKRPLEYNEQLDIPRAEAWARLMELSRAANGHRPKRKAKRFYFWLGREAEGL